MTQMRFALKPQLLGEKSSKPLLRSDLPLEIWISGSANCCQCALAADAFLLVVAELAGRELEFVDPAWNHPRL